MSSSNSASFTPAKRSMLLKPSHGKEIDMYGGHEFARIGTLVQFDDEDRDNFYSLLESDGVG
ncbi:hypothetical protein BP422_24805 [Brevibacillus formosus]|uniref:Uncharacterized protein n=1 Tax=Brevibacillus formosus TaxID=54913 RepID=A0A220MSW0_9BACL|nr:hypothetical protein BP422_24805 [Brevibacillus formosus]